MIRLLKTKEAAEYLGFAAHTLENWRYQGAGPPITPLGRAVRYDIRDLDKWIEDHKTAA